MSSTRQLAAIMFTDIVGYTSLMGRDEQKAFELLRSNRDIQKPLIKHYNGTWIKELGDGVLASFHTVTDAVFCAAAIHQACHGVEGLKLRIGIHLGEVIFEDNDVFGDGVNIASRLQALASPGSTWVSEAVYKNLVNKKEITSEFIKEERLKNVSEPVKVYEISVKDILRFLPENIKAYQKLISQKPVKKRTVFLTAGIVIAILIACYILFFTNLTKSTLSKNVNKGKSIAVLYFANMTGDKEQEYFSDGLTEEIISRLAKINDLRVTSRTSVLPYKGKAVSIKQIAKELKVTTLLEGSVRKEGNTVRITAQLIDGKTDAHFWSQDFTRDLKDIFQLQSDIAHTIAKKLELNVSIEVTDKINKPATGNIKAFDYYLKARHVAFNQYYYVGDSLAFENSRTMYEKAIELDPGFALAYAGLADLYDAKRNRGDSTSKTDSLRHRFSLEAYQLDSNSAFVNNVRIWMMANRKDPLMDSALYFAAKALRLEPNDYYNWQSVAGLLCTDAYLNLPELAIPFYEKAIELNPLDAFSSVSLGDCYYFVGDTVKSNKAFQSTYELVTTDKYLGVGSIIAWLIRSHRFDEAQRLIAKQNWGEVNWASVYLMIERGQHDEAFKQIPIARASTFIRAGLYALISKNDSAIAELSKVIKRNVYPSLLIDPWKKLHNNLEFQKILVRQKILYDADFNRYRKYYEEFIR